VVDVDNDSVTYCWEQWNLGDYKQSWSNTEQFGPIFRSYPPTTSPIRTFPRTDKLVNNISSYLGEKLPSDARNMTFKLTVRDILNGLGTFNFPGDEITIDVVKTNSLFEVTHPNTNINWTSGTSETITWNVAGTDGGAISCTNVDIYLSIDGGYTYPIQLATNTPNDGSETITVPASAMTTQARVKVKGAGNVFFDISNTNFTLNDPSNVKEIAWQSAVKLYPIPSDDVLHVSNDYKKKLTMSVINALGQSVYVGEVVKRATIQVNYWPTGVYYVRFSEMESGEGIVRTIMVN
jgi:predicted outer membrane repeat protein